MSKEELAEINKTKKELKQRYKNGEFKDNKDGYYLKLMELEDDEILLRINCFDEEFSLIMRVSKNLAEDLMHTTGNMQRFNTELAKARHNRLKAKRYRDKIYSEKYEYYRRGQGGVQLKTSKEYDVWIGKDSRYARTNSYVESYDILIKYLEEAVSQMRQKIFVLQTLVKGRDYETLPSY